jgi:ABC-type branched-subunit amino acid transport system ATPase component
MTHNQPILSIRGVSKSFGGVQAVDNVSFDVRPAAITGLIGPNGAGKSTLINVIAGSLGPSAGSVVFAGGQEMVGVPPHQRARSGLVRTFQRSSEFGRLTVLENLLVAGARSEEVSLWAALAGRRRWLASERELIEQASGLLDGFGLLAAANELASTLSGGQKRLLELGRALMLRPKLLLLDEPCAGVSPVIAGQIEELLQRLSREGLAVLLVEHQLEVIDRLCEQVVVMAQGRVLSTGTMAELRRDPEVVDAYLAG